MTDTQRTAENKTIKDRIESFVIKTIIAVVAVFVVVIGGSTSYFLMEKTSKLSTTRKDAVYQTAQGWFDAQTARVNLIASTLVEGEFTGDRLDEAEGCLAGMAAENEAAYDYYFGLADGTVRAASGWCPDPSEYDPTTRDWYTQAVASDGVYISECYVDADSGKVVITISKAMYDNGSLVGVFAADFFTDALTDMIDEQSSSSTFGILVDSDGNIITHKNEDYIPYTDSNGDMVATSYGDAGIPDKLIACDEETKSTTLRYVYRAEYLEDAGISVIVATKFLSYYGTLLLFFGLCLVLLVAFTITMKKQIRVTLNQMFDPLGELNEVADHMTQGILEYSAGYTNPDEIGELCLAIEKSNESIRSYIDDIGEKLATMSEGDLTVAVNMDYIGNFASLKESINGISQSLREAMTIIAEAATAVHQTAGNVAQGAGGLAQDVEHVIDTVNEVNDQIGEIEEGFQESLKGTEESMKLSNQSKEYLDKSYEQIQELLQAMDEITERSNNIAEIIEIINGIASQTNLLALNASIEAARAGEAGKGFAVVADSVRQLAEQTTEAAANTNRLIEESSAAVKRGNELAVSTTEKM